MSHTAEPTSPLSRRRFVQSGVALASAVSSPLLRAWGRSPTPSAKYERVSMTSQAGLAMLESYKVAIAKLLKLPPTDPRNWYRNVLVHTLDCPHGNYWLLPWHRGYIGWFEQVVREASGNPSFAFPFWDWTQTPFVPTVFWNDDLLNPANGAFIDSLAKFQQALTDPMDALWKTFTPQQIAELKVRMYSSMSDVWSAISGDPMFFVPGQARALTEAAPNFDTATKRAVSLETILAALKPTSFVPFGSYPAESHEAMSKSGILESQPHNLVHNCVAGFMSDFLSPVDPIFFMHHSNLDRLWDVWTRKQEAQHLPTLPPAPSDPSFTPWAKEPFLFYSDAKGKPVLQTKAGDYATVGSFQYSYGQGTGEEVISAPAPSHVRTAQTFDARLTPGVLGTVGNVSIPPALLTLNAEVAATAPSLVAHITIDTAPLQHGTSLDVYLGTADGGTPGTDSPNFVGSIQMFGVHRHAGPLVFDLPIPQASVANARTAGLLKTGQPLALHLVHSNSNQRLLQFPIPASPALKVTNLSITAS